MAESLEAPRHPFTVGRGLDHNSGAGPGPEHGVEARGLGADALFHHFAPVGEDVDLAFSLVHVDANMVHSWLASPVCGVDRGCSCGAVYATTLSGEASRLHPIFALTHGTQAARAREK